MVPGRGYGMRGLGQQQQPGLLMPLIMNEIGHLTCRFSVVLTYKVDNDLFKTFITRGPLDFARFINKGRHSSIAGHLNSVIYKPT